MVSCTACRLINGNILFNDTVFRNRSPNDIGCDNRRNTVISIVIAGIKRCGIVECISKPSNTLNIKTDSDNRIHEIVIVKLIGVKRRMEHIVVIGTGKQVRNILIRRIHDACRLRNKRTAGIRNAVKNRQLLKRRCTLIDCKTQVISLITVD